MIPTASFSICQALCLSFFLLSAIAVARTRGGAADTTCAPLFCPYEVADGRPRQNCHNPYDNQISHIMIPFIFCPAPILYLIIILLL